MQTAEFPAEIPRSQKRNFSYTNTLPFIAEDMIKTARRKRKLTQEQLGELVGVKKAQISRLENSTGNVTFETVMRIFNALGAKLNLNLQL